METPSNRNHLQIRIRLGLIFIAIGGLFSLGWLCLIPTESGLSLIRLGLVSFLGLGILLPLVGVTPVGFHLLSRHISTWNTGSVTNRRGIFWLSLIAFNGVYLILLAPEAQDIVARAWLMRLSPLFFYFTLISIVGIILLVPAQLPKVRQSISHQAVKLTLSIFGGLLLGWGLVWVTSWGLIPEPVGWYAMGIPLLETYVFLAWLIVLMAGKAVNWWHKQHPKKLLNWRFDIVVVICLYLLAAWVWRITPAPYNWFVTQPYPPNQQPYPSSDALRYDTTAQSMLIGEGLKTDNSLRTLRPLYTGTLSILHAFSGPDYQPVIDLQPFVLAIFPIFLYLLGCQLHSRMAGLFLALLIILREQTAIELSERITISHAKLLMADLPTAVALTGFVLLAVTWLKAGKPRWQMALFSGGALGASMLIRSESLLLAAVVGFVALINWRKQLTTLIIQLVIFGLGIGLMTTPWIYRNWQRYDTIFFDAPEGRLSSVIKRALIVPPSLPEETPIPTLSVPLDRVTGSDEIIDPTANPVSPTPAPDQIPNETIEQAITIISDQPEAVTISIINHFFNSEIQSILAMPTTFRLPDSFINFLYHRDLDLFRRTCCKAIGYFERMPYWRDWGYLPTQAILPLLGNLFMISIGIAWAYRHLRWAGIFPLMAHVAFLAGNALFRTSGGRYILPVNWIMIVYFSVGVITLTIWSGKLLAWISNLPGWNTASVARNTAQEKIRQHHWATILIPVIGLILLGWTLPFLESIYPQRYTPETYDRMQLAIKQTLSQEDQVWINSWLTSENIVTRTGQALYPRFLKAGVGEVDKDPNVMERDYDRLTFSLIGPYNLRVHLPLSELENGFPNGDDVFVAGCIYTDDNREVIDAKFVARVGIDGTVQDILWRDPESPSPCMP